MPILHGPLDPQGHALVQVALHPSTPRVQALQAAGLTPPQPVLCTGMLDTGATVTIIDPRIRQALGLVPYRIRPILVPSQPVSVNVYAYKLDLFIFDPAGPVAAHLRASMLSVVETPIAHTNVDVLVGCDVLSFCHFGYDGRSASFTLAF